MASPSTTTPTIHSSNRLGVVIALLLLYFVWGSTYLGNKIAIETIAPFPMLTMRFLLAGTLLYGFLRLRGIPNPTRSEWIASGTAGILLLNGGLGLVVFSQQWVASSLAAIIVTTMPLWLALFARFFGERTTIVEIVGMLLGVIGVALLNGEADLRAHPLALLVFVGPICWAFGSAYSRKLSQPKGLMSSAVQMLVAGVMFGLFTWLSGEAYVQPSLRSALAILYLIFFGSIVAYSAYIYLLEQRIRPALTTSYAYINPLIAVILGVGLAGEVISPLGYGGMVVILVSVALVVMAKSFKRP